MTFLTPLAALAALAALLPLAAWTAGGRRIATVRAALGLGDPSHRPLGRIAAAGAAVVLLGLAAAQPTLTHDAQSRERTDAQALFVLDTSRSMAASATGTSPTRLDRAVAAAVRLRAAISDVPSGIATLTDRVLPDLLPVGDVPGFDATAQRGVAIESPPPADTSIRATTFGALGDIATGNFFPSTATRRLVVLLTDGESNPVDTTELAHTLSAARGYRFVAVRLWHGGEAVYDPDGKVEPSYRPDPLGRVVLGGVAGALGGHAFEERDLAAAAKAVRAAAGSGPTRDEASPAPSRTPLAPYLALIALILLFVAFVPRLKPIRAVPWSG
jgi:hypothetical protein